VTAGDTYRAAVEQAHAARVARLRQRRLDDAQDDGVGHQVASIHVRLGLEPERGPAADRRAKLVARREGGNAKRRCEQRRLCPLPGARLAEEKDDHRYGRMCREELRILRAPTGDRGS